MASRSLRGRQPLRRRHPRPRLEECPPRWPVSAGATSYRIYRSTVSGGEGNTPIASTSATSYKDSNLSSTPIYFYQLTAVNASGESARTAEDASKTPPPIGTGGNVAGVAVGNGKVYYCKDALLGGFDWF